MNTSISEAVGQVGASLLPIGASNAYLQVSTLSRLINPFGIQLLLTTDFPNSPAWQGSPGLVLDMPTPLVAFVSIDYDEFVGYAAGVMLAQAGEGVLSYCAVGDQLQFLQSSATYVVDYWFSYPACSLVDATSSFSAFVVPVSSNGEATGFVFQTFNGDITFGYCSGHTVFQHQTFPAPTDPYSYQILMGSTGTRGFLIFQYFTYGQFRGSPAAALVFFLSSGPLVRQLINVIPSDIGSITNCYLYADGVGGLYLHYIGSESSRVLFYYMPDNDPTMADFTHGAVIPTAIYISPRSPFAFARANKFGNLVYFFYNYPAQYLQCNSATASQYNPTPICEYGNFEPSFGTSEVIAAAINQVDTGLAVIFGDIVNGVYASASCGAKYDLFEPAFYDTVTNNLNVDSSHPEVNFEQLSLVAISNDCSNSTGVYFAIPYIDVLEIFGLPGEV